MVVTLDNPTTRNEDPKPFPFQWRKNADENSGDGRSSSISHEGIDPPTNQVNDANLRNTTLPGGETSAFTP